MQELEGEADKCPAESNATHLCQAAVEQVTVATMLWLRHQDGMVPLVQLKVWIENMEGEFSSSLVYLWGRTGKFHIAGAAGKQL